MSAPVQTRARVVQGRYRVGSLDLVDLDVDSPAGGFGHCRNEMRAVQGRQVLSLPGYDSC